jgi:hypothetical protein
MTPPNTPVRSLGKRRASEGSLLRAALHKRADALGGVAVAFLCILPFHDGFSFWMETRAGGVVPTAGASIARGVWKDLSQVPTFMGEERAEFPGANDLFGDIDGLEAGPGESVYVVDRLAHQVFQLDSLGKVLRVLGGAGNGPGELVDPCCPVVTGDSMLWVNSPRDRRVDGFPIEPSTGPPKRITVRGASGVPTRDRVGVRRDGTMVLNIIESSAPGVYELVMLHVGVDGVLRRTVRPPPFADSSGFAIGRWPDGREIPLSIPLAPMYIRVLGRDGSYAQVVTSEYHIRHFESDGSLRREITRNVPGRALTRQERTDLEARRKQLDVMVRRDGARITHFPDPKRGPILTGMWFDSEMRLWVETDTANAGMRIADVYDRDGTLAFRAHWSTNVDLADGATHGTTAWGVRTTSLGEESVVRLVFKRVQ